MSAPPRAPSATSTFATPSTPASRSPRSRTRPASSSSRRSRAPRPLPAGAEIEDDLTFSAIWADGDDAYPITAQTWIIAYKQQTDAAKADALKAFLTYILTDGQTLAPEVNYAPLPKDLDDKALAQLDAIEIG